MSTTHFSGPLEVTGENGGFKLTAILTAALPSAATANTGLMNLISDNGAGDNETALVVSTGSAWVTVDGNALD